ncbi:diphosphomevalonate decarboxylase [Flavobacterium branchiophilum NBRC 15030 = ATCC 35035]|uniref:Diphosphomevalonate decarboxylase n=1 Tax=Flavobacterium branchiophilum TaxID=55197 RepID=A0A543G0A3_9FLAO|nr:diphosphomevalonate decarboxylase [Flavobacterium branchiophilum]OXA75895.1 diphosphomevalonate decarboxylase [Flavobacterium branchiophilum NBRC 15030 = ATCC 35035]TQM39509.1 diphosphomevalonate decarboxylase [Flavobacterium branchiophilum]GEM54037.1 diphosphomevalonate decarboxylase [Flavobacterium branchiophilum NBRC 15030 = ATCC 35035]
MIIQSENQFVATTFLENIQEGTLQWSAPSNIALVKYWGKQEVSTPQIPANPSISFTLNHCKTITQLHFQKKAHTHDFSFELLFEGQPKEAFKPKILQFFERIVKYCPYLKAYHFQIDTQNTFPHSSGIASSASGMAALAMNIMSLEKLLNPQITDEYFYKKASFLARLGSGSACRSIKGQLVIWGQHPHFDSSDVFGIPFPNQIHEVFTDFQDTILLVDKGEKQVSSTLGHNLMHGHPFATQRFEQAKLQLHQLSLAISKGDLETFIAIVESEALTLHAMMMTSMPYFILMKPPTLAIINAIWQFRKTTQIPVCFTLDAGANVHVLYQKKYLKAVETFIQQELVVYCQKGQYICDEVGHGATQMI